MGLEVAKLCGESLELSLELEIVIDELLWKKRRVEFGVRNCIELNRKTEYELSANF